MVSNLPVATLTNPRREQNYHDGARQRRLVIAILADTHRETGHGLSAVTREAIEGTDVLLHAGDFTAPAVYEAFRTRTGRVEAVHGNRDDPALQERLPPKRVFEVGGVRIVLVHGHEHGETALSLLGRSETADLVVFGHSHRPTIIEGDAVTLLNPGSHTQPRGYRAAHAQLDEVGHPESADKGVEARLVATDGSVIDATRIK